jgi:rubrerythrin
MSMLENLHTIKISGIRNFIKTEKNHWTCSKCGGTICVHRGFCFTCGEKKE